VSGRGPFNSRRRYAIALAEDAERAIATEGTLVIDELPGVVLIEVDVAVATTLAREGQYVAVYSFLSDAHRAFAVFQRE
jgi:hypothetical protein